jgi:hypothetical protein
MFIFSNWILWIVIFCDVMFVPFWYLESNGEQITFMLFKYMLQIMILKVKIYIKLPFTTKIMHYVIVKRFNNMLNGELVNVKVFLSILSLYWEEFIRMCLFNIRICNLDYKWLIILWRFYRNLLHLNVQVCRYTCFQNLLITWKCCLFNQNEKKSYIYIYI